MHSVLMAYGKEVTGMDKNKTLFSNVYVIAAVVLAVITAGLILLSGPTKGNSPEGVLNRAEQAMNKHDIKKLITCYDSDTQEMTQYLNSFALNEIFYDANEEDLQYHYIVVSEEKDENSDDSIRLNCMLVVENTKDKTSAVQRETLDFVKEDGKWYIRN